MTSHVRHTWQRSDAYNATCTRCGTHAQKRPSPYGRRWFTEWRLPDGIYVNDHDGQPTPPCRPRTDDTGDTAHTHRSGDAGEVGIKQGVDHGAAITVNQGVGVPVELDVVQPTGADEVVVVLQRDPGLIGHGTDRSPAPASAQRPNNSHARTQQLTRAALDYAARGWRVFPVRPDAKKPPALHSQAACPGRGACATGHRKWEDRATTDPERIAAAWAHGPYGVGIACGPSRLVVIDLDVPEPGEQPPDRWALPGIRDGADVLALLAERAGAVIDFDTFTVTTPRGGMHLYYTAPPGTRIGNRAGERGAGLGWKVDVRGWGGYVLAPPSTNTGRYYRLTHDTAPAPLPQWLTGLLSPAPPTPPPLECPPSTANGIGDLSAYARTALQGERQRVTDARTGGRNHALNKAAYNLGRLVGAGLLTADQAAEHLTQAAAVHLGPGGLTPAEIRTTIASGLTAGTRNPRTITRGNT